MLNITRIKLQFHLLRVYNAYLNTREASVSPPNNTLRQTRRNNRSKEKARCVRVQLQISIEARPSRDSFPRVVVNLPKNSRLGWNANGTPILFPDARNGGHNGQIHRDVAGEIAGDRAIVILSNRGVSVFASAVRGIRTDPTGRK